ncbi:hypothetical protein NQ318_000398 [Aromia moschata]|uniref:Uncharacterized protein n=1 Tax=Aromia moschata TaxID=1265417 RepID=A0AAV8YTY4_9CUCU|nr:hypothetical protein NQ318_000398 [Aromia moschata]
MTQTIDNIRDLFEILMQRDNLEDRLGLHQVVRKSRGPQLRLRFGKRTDIGYEPVVVERPPSLRLRFGKRSEENSVPAYMAGISSEGDN